DRGVQALCPPQDTRVRAQPGGRGQPPVVAVTNRLGGEEVTHALVAESAAEAQRWLEAFEQHLCDLGQWKQCCEELMRIEEPPPRRPPAPLPPQGSLYHQTAPPGPPGPPPGRGAPAAGERLGRDPGAAQLLLQRQLLTPQTTSRP
ncbi:rhotekin-like, partial [Corapipo altera]|uniref:rhotekin-like n=1 Tax=Corapipo altera TaxID=415028 RepID=UPI000FD6AE46